jgi:hypothetical protein
VKNGRHREVAVSRKRHGHISKKQELGALLNLTHWVRAHAHQMRYMPESSRPHSYRRGKN